MQAVVFLCTTFLIARIEDAIAESFCPLDITTTKITTIKKIPIKFILQKDGCTCLELPGDHTACYNDPKCQKFPTEANITTPKLLIKFVSIDRLELKDFVNVTKKLEGLEINSPNLTRISPHTFTYMNNLTELYLFRNLNLKYLERDSLVGLRKLRHLHIIENGFTNIFNITQALSTSTVPEILSLTLKLNVFQKVYNYDFITMKDSSLEELNLFSSGINEIHPDAFLPLINLKILNLGDNDFNVSTLTNVINNTIGANIPLKKLYLESIGLRKIIPKKLGEVISKSNISYLSLSKNSFNLIDNKTFPKMNNLEHLDLTEVSLKVIKDGSFKQLMNLKTLILNRNELSAFPPDLSLLNLRKLELVENNEKIYGTQFSLSKYQFINLKKLECLDLSHNRLLALRTSAFVGAAQLKYLNLKNCRLVFIENNTFVPLKGLNYLNLGNNNLNEVWNVEKYHPSLDNMFLGLENLMVLLLNNNGLAQLSIKESPLLNNLISLKSLNLSENNIKFLSTEDFKNLNNLEILDVSKNNIIAWDHQIFDTQKLKYLYASENKIIHITKEMLGDFLNLKILNLEMNVFSCNCSIYTEFSKHSDNKIKQFFEILQEEIFCNFNNQTFKNFITDTNTFIKHCLTIKKIILYFAPLTLMLLILIVLTLLTFIYRWHIRYWIFLARLYITRKGKVRSKSTDLNYEYDAFVSYCNEDQLFVMKLIETLEKYPPFYKLCIYEREFKIGSIISESIIKHIAKSRKTIILVSESYAKSYWCSWETQIAEHHRLFFENPVGEYVNDSIVLIKLGIINESRLSPTLKYLLKTRIYLQWEPNVEKHETFWRKLKNFLGSPCNINDKIREITHL